MEKESLARLTALAHPQRLAVFRLLMRRYPDHVPAGEIAAALEARPSTLSTYLSTLTAAGLIVQARRGTSLRYAVDMAAVRDTFDYLLTDCCRGRIGPCDLPFPDRHPRTDPMADRPFAVLFICTGNSARSIFAESLLAREGQGRFVVHSAGTRPYSELNPFALELLQQKGHDITRLRAKNVAEFQGPGAPRFDFVFTVCDRAANEECPAWPGQPISAHWGLPDPVKVTGTDAEKSLAFQQVYGALRNRILAFTALPLESLDRLSLQRAVDRIAASDPAEA